MFQGARIQPKMSGDSIKWVWCFLTPAIDLPSSEEQKEECLSHSSSRLSDSRSWYRFLLFIKIRWKKCATPLLSTMTWEEMWGEEFERCVILIEEITGGAKEDEKWERYDTSISCALHHSIFTSARCLITTRVLTRDESILTRDKQHILSSLSRYIQTKETICSI